MTTNRSICLLYLFTLFLLVGCTSGVTVTSDHTASVDFSNYKTFRWRDANEFNAESRHYLANEIIDGRIKAAVEETLAGKGFRKLDQGRVDFYVNYSVTTKEKVDIRTYNTYGGYGPGYYGHRGYGGSESRVDYYQEGTLVIDILDTSSDILVWRGVAEGKLHKKKTPEERRERLKEVVALVLADFPPQAPQVK